MTVSAGDEDKNLFDAVIITSPLQRAPGVNDGCMRDYYHGLQYQPVDEPEARVVATTRDLLLLVKARILQGKRLRCCPDPLHILVSNYFSWWLEPIC